MLIRVNYANELSKHLKWRRNVIDMPVLIRLTKNVLGLTNNFLGQVMRSVSEGKYNTVNNTTCGGSNLSKYSNNHWQSPLVPTCSTAVPNRVARIHNTNQLVPMSTRAHVHSYPCQLVPKSTVSL